MLFLWSAIQNSMTKCLLFQDEKASTALTLQHLRRRHDASHWSKLSTDSGNQCQIKRSLISSKNTRLSFPSAIVFRPCINKLPIGISEIWSGEIKMCYRCWTCPGPRMWQILESRTWSSHQTSSAKPSRSTSATPEQGQAKSPRFYRFVTFKQNHLCKLTQ